MDIKYIEQLLESFYEGATSIEEERVLFDFFQGTDVPESMKDEQQLFLKLYRSEEIAVPFGLESKLENLIDELDKDNKSDTKPARPKIKSINWKWVSGIAASIVIFISA